MSPYCAQFAGKPLPSSKGEQVEKLIQPRAPCLCPASVPGLWAAWHRGDSSSALQEPERRGEPFCSHLEVLLRVTQHRVGRELLLS